ncbi:MAG: bifunctional folylpolyglutamate synthase/dihydrofolate synthase [Prevotella sp.]|nr:bifunctional folylpolyglutamate synthase/dihydrofolate synthase [Prevotella sp.]
MNYQETVEYLFSQTSNYEVHGTQGYKTGLDTTLALDEHFGHPHKNFRCIHVGGTNGKGSVSHLLAAQLQVCGYRVGLYTSPHLVDFSERIRVNGQPIPQDYVVNFVNANRDYFETLSPSFFELATAMAFKYFSDADVDIAVVEVGLGGRLDCTNIITPILSVITNVSLDHTQLLGNTLEQIAFEKAGIMKPGVPCIIGSTTPETRPVYEAVAKEVGAKVIFAEDEPVTTLIPSPPGDSHYQHYRNIFGIEFACELCGLFQVQNMNTLAHSLVTLMDLGYLCTSRDPRNSENIRLELNEALMNVTKLTGLRGRWQTVRTNPTVVCDTGHNPGAWEYLSRQLSDVKCREMRIVFGMVEDKDVFTVMSLLPKNATYYFTKGSTKRALSEASLKVFGEQLGLKGECYPTVADAYNAAIDGATSEDFIFIGGSTYIVADYLKTRL